jgi:hypothetical protein
MSRKPYSYDIKHYGNQIYANTMELEYGIRYFLFLVNTFDGQIKASKIPGQQKNYLAKKFLYFYGAKIRGQLQLMNPQTIQSNEKSGAYAKGSHEAEP